MRIFLVIATALVLLLKSQKSTAITHCLDDFQCRNHQICYNEVCIDACSLYSCGETEICSVSSHRVECRCRVGFKRSQAQSGHCERVFITGHLKSIGDCKPGTFCKNIKVFFMNDTTQTIDSSDIEISSSYAKFYVEFLRIHFEFYNSDRVNENFRYLPVRVSDVFPNLRSFSVRKTAVKWVTKDTFRSLVRLETVYLDNNRIEVIDADSFGDLAELKVLDVSGNSLRSLHDHLFRSTVKLEVLDLRSNGFEELSRKVFRNLRRLKKLDLSGAKLREISWAIFENLVSLEHLNLGHNKFKSLPYGLLDNLEHLRRFDASYNRLTSLDEHFFKYNRKLEDVRLRGNKIVKLSANVFRFLPRESKVDLEGNRCVNRTYGHFDDHQLRADLIERC